MSGKNQSYSRRQLITKTDARSPVTEQYKTIRTNIQFSAIDHILQQTIRHYHDLQ